MPEDFDPKEFIRQYGGASSQLATPESSQSDEPGYLRQFGGGIAQGAIFDPVTGINQLIEHASDNKIGLPDSVKKWLEDYKDKYTSGTVGKIGEGIGTIGSLIIPGSTAVKGVSLLEKGASALGKGVRAAGDIAAEGGGALGRLARIIKTPPPAVQGLKGRARPGAGAAAKAFRKGKMLEEPAKTAEAATESTVPRSTSTLERMAIGASGGAVGGAVQPVDEDQDDFWKQKGAQTLAGGAIGGLLGTPQAAPVLATGLIGGAFKEFGALPTAMALSALYPSLRALAAHHNSSLYHAGGMAAGAAEKFLQRPGAAYAAGRASAPFTGPAGEAIWEQLDDK